MNAIQPKSSRKMRIALAISLALNLLVVGAIVGGSFTRGDDRGRDRSARSEEQAIGIYGRALDKSQRREVGRAIRAGGRAEGRALRSELRSLAEEAVAVLRVEPFDAGAFEDILVRQQAMIKSRVDDAQGALSGFVAQMSPAERASYADRLTQVLQRSSQRKTSDRD